MAGPVVEEPVRCRPAEGLMVGVDHTSGTDTKTEAADQPQASDSAPQPPPDRPGSPGQPSRQESRATARAPAESGSGGEQRDGKPFADETRTETTDTGEPGTAETGTGAASEGTDRRDEPNAAEPGRDEPRPGESGEPGESGAEKTGGPVAAERPGVEGGRASDDDPATVGRPRAESWAGAIEPQQELSASRETSETGNPEQPGTQDRPAVGGQADDRRAGEALADAGAGDDREPVAGSSAAETSDAQAGDVGGPGRPGAEQVTEPAEPPEAGRGPRAESWARAMEPQKAADTETSDTDAPAPATTGTGAGDAPGPQHRADERAETSPNVNENGEPVATQPADRVPDSDANAPDRPEEHDAQTGGRDAPGQEPRAGNDGGTDTAEPLLADREPGIEDDSDPGPGSGETEEKAAETGEPATEPRPRSEAPGEPGRDPAERTDDRPGDAPGSGEPAAPDAEDTPNTSRETDDTGRQPADHDDPQPSPEDTERPDEIADGTGDGNDDRGRNAENQPASPAPEESETDPFAGLPTRADLDPATAGELTRERGEPLTPVNENQDLREPDPEDDSDWNRFLRSTRNDNVEEAVKTINDVGIKAQKVLGDRPPTGHPGVVHDRNPQIIDTQHTANYGDAATAIIGVAIVVAELGRRAHNGIQRMRGNQHGDHR
ncbi:hypothetical protein ACH35V_23460 [Actinomadura sp. 1N219]|uniref:hypothetical protein n=1 Tax=Actinomadura sp. 1N219 TaxID=3375152 RepID=UPI0037B51A52